MTKQCNFVHLHNHSEYSFLDGAIGIKKLVARAKQFGMPVLKPGEAWRRVEEFYEKK